MDRDQKPLGAHGGGIPPGWDFPEARAAAEEGFDLWLLDSNLRLPIAKRIELNFSCAALAETLRQAGCARNG